MRTALIPVAVLAAGLVVAPRLGFAQAGCPAVTPAGELDPVAIRRKAKELGQLAALLADADANVRLLTIKQAMGSCDPTVRDAAIEYGLASNETAMVTAALRGTIVGRAALVLRYNNAKEPSSAASENASWVMTIDSYDAVNGKLVGRSACGYNDSGEWTGFVNAAAITFVTKNAYCSGRMDWNAEKAQFKGVAVLEVRTAERAVSWNPF